MILHAVTVYVDLRLIYVAPFDLLILILVARLFDFTLRLRLFVTLLFTLILIYVCVAALPLPQLRLFPVYARTFTYPVICGLRYVYVARWTRATRIYTRLVGLRCGLRGYTAFVVTRLRFWARLRLLYCSGLRSTVGVWLHDLVVAFTVAGTARVARITLHGWLFAFGAVVCTYVLITPRWTRFTLLPHLPRYLRLPLRS